MNLMHQFEPDFATAPDYAKLYRKLGMQVVPAYSPQDNKSWKRPALSSWREFEQKLVSDAVFDGWFGIDGTYRHKANLGFICGPCSSGLFIVDVDLQKGEEARLWLDSVQQQCAGGEAFKTPTQRTGGGGLQLLFRAPQGWNPPTCKTLAGIDIRGGSAAGGAGFAMLPPSVHETGQRYQWLSGFEPWVLEPLEASEWLCREIDRLAQAHSGRPAGTGAVEATESPEYATDAFAQIVDGRESYATRLVFAWILNLRRNSPILPPTEILSAEIRKSWEFYEQKVKSRLTDPNATNGELLEREGRGFSMILTKWHHALAQWDTKVADQALILPPSQYKAAPSPKFDPKTGEVLPVTLGDEFSTEPTNDVYELLDIQQILDMPDPIWLLDGLILAGASVGFLTGAPASGKSFIMLSICLAVAAGKADWFGRQLKAHGAVFYVSSEGVTDMKLRLQAWGIEHGIDIRGLPFFLLHETINFVRVEDQAKLKRTVHSGVERAGIQPALIVVDTWSRVLAGSDENSTLDAGIAVAAIDDLKVTFKCPIAAVHHLSKACDMRGSTVYAAAADWVISADRTENENTGNLIPKKIKAGPDHFLIPYELKKITIGDPIKQLSSLTAVPVDESKINNPIQANGWPHRVIVHLILDAIDQAWRAGKPWSPHAQARKEGRYAVANMSRWDIKPDMAERMVEAWQSRNVLSYEINDRKSKLKGLKVIGRTESDGGEGGGAEAEKAEKASEKSNEFG